MDKIKNLIDSAINEFNKHFPDTKINIEEYRTKENAAIDRYEKKLSLLPIDVIFEELKQYQKSAEKFLSSTIDHINKGHRGHERNFLIALIETTWIPAMINKITKSQRPKSTGTQRNNKNFSHKAIAIAYHVLGIAITKENAATILKKHSKLKSAGKLLQTRVSKPSDLTALSGNKTADMKHLNTLKNAKRLVNGKKNKEAATSISRIITAFQTAYNKEY